MKNETYKELTRTKVQIIGTAIRSVGSAETDDVYSEVVSILKAKYKDDIKKLQKIEMATEQDIKDTIESYVALHEYDLVNKGLLNELEGRMITEKIKKQNAEKLNAKKNCQ